MPANVDQFVALQVRRFEADCRRAEQLIRQARSIPEVIRYTTVHSDPTIRSIARSMPCTKALRQQAITRLRALIAEQLAEVANECDPEARKELLGRLRVREWDSLRGDYAMQWREADAEAHRLLRKA